MPAPATVAEFVEFVRRSDLVPEDRLRAELHRPHLQPAANPTIEAVAQALVAAGLLTKFQSKQVRLGRYKRFEIAGKYRLLELLGIGGMGAVYLCEHKFMKRLVALKVLPVEKLQDPSALMRFYREARAVAALDHPNIVRAYDIDVYDKMHFLVMEFVDGVSVQEVVARHGRLSPERAANYTLQAAHGLHHAHQLGMVHRDIKPGNLLLERTGSVKILDMGLARFFDQSADNVTEKFDNNCVLGTADYLAPEQAISSVVDIRADIYALGGTLYFMLTGQSPFPDGTIAHKLLCHQKEEPQPLRAFRSDVPAGLAVVLDRMLRKNPDERYQTPAELFAALSGVVDEAPVPPPQREMPELCPAVLAITGHAMDKARGTGSRLAPARAAGPASGAGSGLLFGGAPSGAGGFESGTALAALMTGSSGELPVGRGGVAPSTYPQMAAGTPTWVGPATAGGGDRSARQYLIVGAAAGLALAAAGLAGAAAVWLAVR